MVIALSNVSRDLLNLRQALNPHQDVLTSFIEAGKKFFGIEFSNHLNSIFDEYYRIKHSISVNSETLNELRETNNSLLSTKQNEVMKIFTIMAFVTFPLMLVTSIFGMNTDYLPIVGHNFDFLIIIGIMAVLAIVFFIFFKYKKWL